MGLIYGLGLRAAHHVAHVECSGADLRRGDCHRGRDASAAGLIVDRQRSDALIGGSARSSDLADLSHTLEMCGCSLCLR